MRYKSYRNVLLSILVTGLLVSCSSNPTTTATEALETQAEAPATMSITQQPSQRLGVIDGCIQAFESFAYKILSDDTKPIPGREDIVPLGSPWVVETTLKIPAIHVDAPWLRSKVMGIRINNNVPEIWVGNTYYYQPTTGSRQTFSIYSPGTQQWRYIDVDLQSNNGAYYYISKLFFAQDGSIWGVTEDSGGLLSDNKSVSILSKYNEEQNKFEFDLNAGGTPKIVNGAVAHPRVLFGNDGDFWIIIEGDALYHYDPYTKKFENKLSLSSLHITSAVITPDNSSIYIMTYYPKSLVPESKPYLYSIQKNTLDDITVPAEILSDLYSNMLFDPQERLWLDSVAWMEINGEWYTLIQPTIFITNYPEGLAYRWREPSLMQVTSDGRLWFVGENGSTWLDPNEQKWCWYTTEQVVPVEDESGVLWIVGGDKLYRSSIGQ